MEFNPERNLGAQLCYGLSELGYSFVSTLPDYFFSFFAFAHFSLRLERCLLMGSMLPG